MKITPNELFKLNKWIEYCNLKGVNEWAVNEGMMDSNEDLDLTIAEAEKLGIIK